MPQLTSDEWPADGELTTTEQEVPVTEAEAAAVAEWRARMEHVRYRREPACEAAGTCHAAKWSGQP